MYFLAADPNDMMFTNNLRVCKGVFPSPSYLRTLDDNLKHAVSMYEVRHIDKAKEAVFEDIRQKHYSARPSRMGAIYLFQDLETAIRANGKWWNNQRLIYETRIKNGSIVMIADSQWLNCKESEYEANAHNYFKEVKTDNPLIELVVMGVVEVSQQPVIHN